MSGHVFGLFLVGLFWVSVAVAVAIDATKRGRYGSVWAITVFFLGPVGLGLYVLAVLSSLATR